LPQHLLWNRLIAFVKRQLADKSCSRDRVPAIQLRLELKVFGRFVAMEK
jgi:hypothetical protein